MPHLNRTVDDPLLAGSAYKAYSYQNPTIGEQDLEKTLDLDKLDFSLDDFQKLSQGTYNAGEFRLTDSGKLDIVNNHKTWTIFNNKPVDGADSYAIRVAFAKAMEDGGLDDKAMKAVRKALGLGPYYTLGNGKALKPLTRQEVRELIDANIVTLNAGRAENNRLKTYDQIHANYSTQEKEEIRAAREEINRTGGANTEINSELMDVLTVTKKNPSFEGMSVEDAEYYLEFIDELSTSLERLVDKDARYDWVRENHTRYKVTVSGGAIGMAIALDDGDVVFETITDGKRSRINLGLTPQQLQERLDQSHAKLNEIAILEVDDTIKLGKDDAGGDDLSDDVSLKARPKKSNPSGNILNESGIRNDNLEIKEDPSPEARNRTANKNLNTLASLLARHYGFEVDVATNLLKQIDDWEEQLAECNPSGNPTTLTEVNDDLRNFLLNNSETIDSLIKEARADMDA